MPKFIKLADESELSRLLDESHQRPVVLFLHDEFCAMSSMAYDEMLELDGEIALVDVTVQHDVKRAVESRTGVKHQSPQTIILRNGATTWDASHGKIRADRVREAIQKAT